MELIDKAVIDKLLCEAAESPRLRMNHDMRTSAEDNSQRMLNALMPGTEVAIHRHPESTETVICLCGKMDEICYDENGKETERYCLCPKDGIFGCSIPAGTWHTVYVYEPTVILEAKDGKYGSDGSEVYCKS